MERPHAAADADPQGQQDYLFALVAAGPALVWLLSAWAVHMAAPAAIGIVISEALAIRSWLFHAANGALASWIGWVLTQNPDAGDRYDYGFLAEPRILVAAGLAAGLAYWLVAGWTAGFRRPVRAPRPAPPDLTEPEFSTMPERLPSHRRSSVNLSMSP